MNFFNISMKDITGKMINFNSFNQAKCFLIVNVASEWGLTKSNYTALSKMYEEYHSKGLEIFGFPCNQFGAQEPWSEDKIVEFVKKQFNVKFPMFSKVEVNGVNACDLYKYMKENYKAEKIGDIQWNFAKFLLNRKGEVIKYFGPKVHPDELRPFIEAELNKW